MKRPLLSGRTSTVPIVDCCGLFTASSNTLNGASKALGWGGASLKSLATVYLDTRHEHHVCMDTHLTSLKGMNCSRSDY